MSNKRITVTDWLLMSKEEREVWANGADMSKVKMVAPNKPKNVNWDLELKRLWGKWLKDK